MGDQLRCQLVFVGGGGSEVMDHKKVVFNQSYDITFHKYIIFDEDNRKILMTAVTDK